MQFSSQIVETMVRKQDKMVKMMFECGLPRLKAKGIASERIVAAMEQFSATKLMANMLRSCNAQDLENKTEALNAAAACVGASDLSWPDPQQSLSIMMAKQAEPPTLQHLQAEKPPTQAQLRKSLLGEPMGQAAGGLTAGGFGAAASVAAFPSPGAAGMAPPGAGASAMPSLSAVMSGAATAAAAAAPPGAGFAAAAAAPGVGFGAAAGGAPGAFRWPAPPASSGAATSSMQFGAATPPIAAGPWGGGGPASGPPQSNRQVGALMALVQKK